MIIRGSIILSLVLVKIRVSVMIHSNITSWLAGPAAQVAHSYLFMRGGSRQSVLKLTWIPHQVTGGTPLWRVGKLFVPFVPCLIKVSWSKNSHIVELEALRWFDVARGPKMVDPRLHSWHVQGFLEQELTHRGSGALAKV